MEYKLCFKYVYTFYNFGEPLTDEVIEEEVEVSAGARFTLYQQEDGSFQMSGVEEDSFGKFVILTFPNKDNLIIRAHSHTELAYDEYYSAMGDDNHNVYEGTVSLVCKT